MGNYLKPSGPFPQATKYSIFAYGVQERDYRRNYTNGYISATEYCRKNNISRYNLRYMAKKQWIMVTKTRKSRIMVKNREECQELIDEYIAKLHQPNWYGGRRIVSRYDENYYPGYTRVSED
ncbi:hypothetical protein [Cyanothece sp. BG0011]|uniref:hypothetical protein n=1 Tax=Cyanothece sp. BG0011 TaxID=2082950 RepID=UPI000D1F3F6C|nr:hypothetical protein [Cyanothece sp. BG0011]